MTQRDPELDHWLAELRRRRWLMIYLPSRENPQVVASVLRHPACVDVIALFGETEALAYRSPAGPGDDPLRPRLLTWVYAGAPTWTIRAALALPEPGARGEPVQPQAPPPLCQALARLAGPNRTIRPPNC
jgi:hypothetical protein